MGMAVSTRAGWASRNTFHRLGVGLAAATLLGLCVAGCATAPQAPAAYASASPRGPTVAFDSIDGPPETVFQQLVQDLSDEAAARQMAVVSRESPAQYRVRGYLAALVSKQRTTVISWVWDVYDANQQRALRISGEEPANRSGRGTWAAADDQVLRRIAKTGMDRLAAFLAAPETVPGPPPPSDSRGPNVATIDPARGDAASPALALSADAR
jgi:hypothetical protein